MSELEPQTSPPPAVPAGADEPAPGSARELLRVAGPLIASSASHTIMVVCDRIFLTWYSADSLAAVMPAGMLNWTLISIVFGMCQYANTFVAQYDGAGRPDRVGAAVWQSVWISVVFGSLLMLPGLWPRLPFELAGHAAEIVPLEADYFGTLALGGAIPMTMAVGLSSFYSGRRKTAVVMLVNLAGALVNVVFDALLIFGYLGLPEMGIRGAAVATVLGNVVMVGLYAALILQRDHREKYGTWRNRRFDADLFRRFVRFGLPSGLHQFADIGSFTLFILLVGRLGRDELAATNLAFNMNAIVFVPMLGMGIAVTTLVGHRIGAGQPHLAAKSTWTAFKLTGAWTLLFAAVYVLVPDLILIPYAARSGEDLSPLRDQIVVLLRFVAVYSLFDAMNIVFGAAIRGAGDTRFALNLTLATSWLLMVLPTWIMMRWFEPSLTACWAACTAYAVTLGLGFLLRFEAGHWQTMRVIEHPVTVAEAPS